MNAPNLWHYEFVGEICVNALAAFTYAIFCYWLFLLHCRFRKEQRPGFGFLLPFAIVVGINALFRAGEMILPLEHFLRYVAAYFRSGSANFQEPPDSNQASGIFKQVNDLWDGVDLAVSFVGNYLLFVAGAMVGVTAQKSRLWSGTGLAALVGFALDHPDFLHLPRTAFSSWVVDGTDTAISMAALIWFGWNLANELVPRLVIRNEVAALLLPKATMAVFLALALLQPLYYLHTIFLIHRMASYYALILLLVGTLKILIVIALCTFPVAAGVSAVRRSAGAEPAAAI